MAERPTLTTSSGMPVADNQNSLTAGPRGPVLMQDFHLLEKLAHQNRERIPERIVHAKGSGAYGTLTVTKDITQVHQGQGALAGRQEDRGLPALLDRRRRARRGRRRARRARLCAADSTPRKATGTSSATTRRCSSCATRSSSPTSSTRRSATRKHQSALAHRMWDFWSLSPESLHQVTILFSDRGLPQSYRHMHGFGSHTYSLHQRARTSASG